MWLRSIQISLDRYGSKIRKKCRCRPVILSNYAGVFLSKISSRQKLNWDYLFLINDALLNVGDGGRGVIKNAYSCVDGRGCHASFVRTHLHYLFSCFWQYFCLAVSCFICWNLCEKRLFFYNKINFCRQEISLFYNT